MSGYVCVSGYVFVSERDNTIFVIVYTCTCVYLGLF